MKTILVTTCYFLGILLLNAQTGGVGINTDSITATLDINGNIRIRKLPDTTSHAKYFITANDSGKLFRFPYDSLNQNNSSTQSPLLATFVSGDTITTGDLVAVGDGVSGIFASSAYSNTLSTTSITSTSWLAQTFITGPNSDGIKTVILNFNITATPTGINFICSIRNTSAGAPTGLDINNQTTSVLGPTGNGNYYSYSRFTFDPPIQVSPNTKYAIIIRTQTNGSNLVQRTTTNVYSGGEIFTSTNTGSTWSQQLNFDAWFNTYETNTISGKIYRSNQSIFGGNCIGWNITNSCMWASTSCSADATYFGKRDLLDNPIGIAQNNALPGQNVTVQLSGTATIPTIFPPGRPLFMGPTLGSLSTTPLNSSHQVGLSLGGNKILLRISNQ